MVNATEEVLKLQYYSVLFFVQFNELKIVYF